MATNAELLEKVDAAIVALLEGTVQSFTIHQRTFTYIDLADLIKLRKELGVLAGRDTSGTGGLGYAVPCP